jgi:MFS family permease
VGQLLVIATLAALTYGIIEGPDAGWTSPRIVGCFALSAAALAGLILYEPRRQDPLIDLRFFRSVPFSAATVIAISAFAGLGGFLFLNTLYLQEVRGFSALEAGLYTLPMALMTLVCAPLSGRAVGNRGPRRPLVIAGVTMTVSAVLLTGLTAHTSPAWLFLAYVLFGIGFGTVNAPITNAAVSGMPRSQAGVAAAIASTSRQIGQSLGVAIMGSVVISALTGPLRLGFAQASRVGFGVIAGCGAIVLGLGLVSSSDWASRSAERTAARLTPPEPGETPASLPNMLR